jgi:hypothetical protein
MRNVTLKVGLLKFLEWYMATGNDDRQYGYTAIEAN